eukprot:7420549-Pyramimonas_sp.AAC.1
MYCATQNALHTLFHPGCTPYIARTMLLGVHAGEHSTYSSCATPSRSAFEGGTQEASWAHRMSIPEA